jgi:hypothetical protein
MQSTPHGALQLISRCRHFLIAVSAWKNEGGQPSDSDDRPKHCQVNPLQWKLG